MLGKYDCKNVMCSLGDLNLSEEDVLQFIVSVCDRQERRDKYKWESLCYLLAEAFINSTQGKLLGEEYCNSLLDKIDSLEGKPHRSL